MPILFWDASGLAKRYYAESGSETVHALFEYSPSPIMIATFWGYTETYAILARKRNSGHLTPAGLAAAMSALYYEVIAAENFDLLSIDDKAIMGSLTHILAHNINSVDAALLTTFLEFQASLTEDSPTCILVDGRLAPDPGSQCRGLANPEPGSAHPTRSHCSSRSFALNPSMPEFFYGLSEIPHF